MLSFQGPLAGLGAAAVNNLFTARFAKFRRVWHTKDLNWAGSRDGLTQTCVRPTTAPARAARCRSRSWYPLRTTRAPEVRSWAIARPMNGAAEHLLDSRLGPGATRNDNRYSVAGRCCGCDARHYRHRLRSRAAAGFGQTADISGWRQHERCYFASTQELFGRACFVIHLDIYKEQQPIF